LSDTSGLRSTATIFARQALDDRLGRSGGQKGAAPHRHLETGKPCSAKVARSGQATNRFGPVIASAWNLSGGGEGLGRREGSTQADVEGPVHHVVGRLHFALVGARG